MGSMGVEAGAAYPLSFPSIFSYISARTDKVLFRGLRNPSRVGARNPLSGNANPCFKSTRLPLWPGRLLRMSRAKA